ncbi:SUR7 protein [Drechmeria coniospora]|uniref:SUR7 protein n=1 Tax=Drechmeria coniospora TaxID=98403 RepID=A0A151GQW0_DRECN|nr:SUR7 protein [Drechmeria coniospora]KYK59486.1 SUR7 protein [Drechmeria coniospora]ODA76270.1 hypothetical protein RJ55_08115 [Drechmeria coniospora]
MAKLTRIAILVPLVLALVSFVLTSLTLFAGRKQGFMEDYDVVRLNTSMLGHNLIDKVASKDSTDSSGGALSGIKNFLNSAKDEVKDKVNDITNEIAGKLTSKLGVSQWYSLHVMNSCEGNWTPDPTAPDPSLEVTKCSGTSLQNRLNLTELLDSELKVGSLKLSLGDLNWQDSIQDKLDIINDALYAIFIVYVLAMGLSGLSFLLHIAGFLLPDRTIIVLVNFAVASLAALACVIGSILVSVLGSKGVDKLNEKGQNVGLSATRGKKFFILSWIATVFMMFISVFWLVHLVFQRRQKRTATK